jgi:3'(2'), 5'-bisphosphate nucleotidase
VADFAAQAIVSRMLGRAFPQIPLVAEEDTSALEGSEGEVLLERVCRYVCAEVGEPLSRDDVTKAIGRGIHEGGEDAIFWCLDPIDGTKGFIRGDQYAVALALVCNGEPLLGVLGCPNLAETVGEARGLGLIYHALKGSGAWCESVEENQTEPGRVSVSIRRDADIRFCESVEAAHTRHDASASIAKVLGGTDSVRLDSQCKYAVLARGEADVYLRLPTRPGYEERIWDHAAGWRVLAEAGGMITDVDGNPLDFGCGRTLKRNRGVVASNGQFHEHLLEVVSSAL